MTLSNNLLQVLGVFGVIYFAHLDCLYMTFVRELNTLNREGTYI